MPSTPCQRAISYTRKVRPAFILTQFGFQWRQLSDAMIPQRPGDMTFEFRDGPGLRADAGCLYCLNRDGGFSSSTANWSRAIDGRWRFSATTGLKTNYARFAATFSIRDLAAPNEAISCSRAMTTNSGEAAPMARAIYRHIPETATQRLLLEQGDIDIARQCRRRGNRCALVQSRHHCRKAASRDRSIIFGLNQKNENLAKPEVRQAMKYLVDYATIADTIMKGKVINPSGVPAARLPRRA